MKEKQYKVLIKLRKYIIYMHRTTKIKGKKHSFIFSLIHSQGYHTKLVVTKNFSAAVVSQKKNNK